MVIVVLAIMNIGTLLVLWMSKPSPSLKQGGKVSHKQEQARLEQLLKMELGFDDIQVEQYLLMRDKHHKQSLTFNKKILELKKQMYDEVFHDIPQQLSDSLLNLVQVNQAELEHITFQHFIDLKKLCKLEQQDKLKLLIDEFFSKNTTTGMNNEKRPPPPPDDEGHPPPPGGEGPPPPPRNN